MKNWNSFFIISSIIIALILFITGKQSIENLFDDIHIRETVIVFFKTIAVSFIAVLAIITMVILILIDVLLTVLLRKEFPLFHLLYEHVYKQVAVGWYWDSHSGGHILMACIIMFGLGIIGMNLGSVFGKKKKVVVRKKT